MRFGKSLSPAVLACLVLGLTHMDLAASPDAGPLWDDFDLNLAPGHRLEVLGPLFYE